MNEGDGESLFVSDLSRTKRQVFIPSNTNTNTFVFDTVSFLALLTLIVLIVRVFNRVLQSNNVQRLSAASDPSVSSSGRNLRQFRDSQDNGDIRESELQRRMMSDLRSSEPSARKTSINPDFWKKSINPFFSNNFSQPVIMGSTRHGQPNFDESIFQDLYKLYPSMGKNLQIMSITHSTYATRHLIPPNKIGLSSQAPERDPIPIEVKHGKHRSSKMNKKSQRKVLDRRKRSRNKSDSSDPEASARGLTAIIRDAQAPSVDEGRQLGIAGVDYDTIYLSIGEIEMIIEHLTLIFSLRSCCHSTLHN